MKQGNYIGLIIMTFVFCFFSCKKQDNTNTGANNPTTNGNVTISPSTATNWYGILNAYYLQSLTGGSLQPSITYGTAYFSSAPTPGLNPTSFVKVNKVALSETSFKFGSYQYSDTTFNLNFNNSTWQVDGLGSIPSFSFTNSNPFPLYTGYPSLPDTIHTGQQITIPITGVSNSDEVIVVVADGVSGSGHTISQILGSGTSVTFSVASLSSLTPTNNGTINVACKKNNIQSVGSAPMNFTTNYQLTKTISVK